MSPYKNETDHPDFVTALHHQREILQFTLQNRHRTPGHLHPACRVQGRLRRHTVPAPHQENLQQFRGFSRIEHAALQEIIPECR